MSGAPILLPARHVINLGTLAGDPRADRPLRASADAEPGDGMFWIVVAAQLR